MGGDFARDWLLERKPVKWRRSPLWTPGQTLAHGRYSGNRGPPVLCACCTRRFTCSLASFPGGEAWWRVGFSLPVVGKAELPSGWVTGQGQERLFREQGTILPTFMCLLLLPSQKGLGGVSQSPIGTGSRSFAKWDSAASSRSQGADGSDCSATSARRLWCSPAQTLPVPANHPAEILARLPHF